jgi:hypothetical protein
MYIRKNLEPVWYYGMIMVVFKSVFRLEIYWNNIVFILKKIILISTHQKEQTDSKSHTSHLYLNQEHSKQIIWNLHCEYVFILLKYVKYLYIYIHTLYSIPHPLISTFLRWPSQFQHSSSARNDNGWCFHESILS